MAKLRETWEIIYSVFSKVLIERNLLVDGNIMYKIQEKYMRIPIKDFMNCHLSGYLSSISDDE